MRAPRLLLEVVVEVVFLGEEEADDVLNAHRSFPRRAETLREFVCAANLDSEVTRRVASSVSRRAGNAAHVGNVPT